MFHVERFGPLGALNQLAPLLHMPGPTWPINRPSRTLDARHHAFYRRTLHVLSDAPGSISRRRLHALHQLHRHRARDQGLRPVRSKGGPRAITGSSLRESGYHTEITFPHWLAKAKQGNDYGGPGLPRRATACARWDDAWFEFATEADVLGMPVKDRAGRGAALSKGVRDGARAIRRRRHRAHPSVLRWKRLSTGIACSDCFVLSAVAASAVVSDSLRVHLSVGATSTFSGVRHERAPRRSCSLSS